MPKTILTIENTPEVRQIIVDIVESLGYNCLEANNVRQGLEVLQNEIVDLILLDIHLGGVRGNDFLKYIRDQGIQIPVIIISGYLQKDVVKEVAGLDVKAVLPKPIRIKRFAEEIEKALNPETSV
ncbi:MAG: response regulator [Candidatus Latescibacteria bacterium]|jgi:CitB family two-component system response regulator MalR|nr:response regulator [Candidatus Latescibacterota bacterium]